MTPKGKSIMIASAAFLVGAAGAAALVTGTVPGVKDGERAKIEAIVRDYILEHPEIIPEAMQKLEARQTANAIQANRALIETPFAGGWAGNEKGDATLVVFFDYACGFCRKSLPDIERLLVEDKNLKIVFRELPILSEDSEMAARVSLAAAKQGKFKAFHDALYETGRPTVANVQKVEAALGMDQKAVAAQVGSAEFQKEIDANIGLARTLRFSGTPSWVVGDTVMNGAVGYDALKAAIAEARKKG